ncbi:hypothetical protein ACEPPN_007876 [Leptodophora sp. 'Broadleaf-Isolate-01']
MILRYSPGITESSIQELEVQEYLRGNNFDAEDPSKETYGEKKAVMPEHDGLMRIFWPLDIPKSDSPGVIVGWRNSGLDVFVVAILEDVDARSVENALKVGTLFRNATHPIARIHELCGQSSMHVLGLANTPGVEVENLQMHATIGSSLKVPQISCARASTIQIIVFDRPLPHRMQYISLNPISLALGDKSEIATHAPGTVDAEEEREELKNRKRVKALVEKLKLHTVSKHATSPKELALPRIVNQINCSSELHTLLQRNISLVGRRSRRSLSVSERVVESATTMKDFVVMAIWQIVTVYLYPILRRAFVLGLLCHRIAAETLLLVLEWRAKPDYAALKDVSATAQQVEIRLLQFCYLPLQVLSHLVKMHCLRESVKGGFKLTPEEREKKAAELKRHIAEHMKVISKNHVQHQREESLAGCLACHSTMQMKFYREDPARYRSAQKSPGRESWKPRSTSVHRAVLPASPPGILTRTRRDRSIRNKLERSTFRRVLGRMESGTSMRRGSTASRATRPVPAV